MSVIKGAKSIAEYAIRRYLAEQGIIMSNFALRMEGREGILTDRNGDSVTLVYDSLQKSVYLKEE